jgi:tetratricopeptide (TPR) repeat protein
MSRFDWEQEHNFVKIVIPCLNPVINKPGYFDLFVSRTYVKLHLKSPKLFLDFDFLKDIDPASSLNRTQALENRLELVFGKANPGEHWESLLNPDKKLVKIRREQSDSEVSAFLKAQREIAEKKKIEMDRLSVTEQMRIDGVKRQVLEDKMQEEKTQAIKEMFASKPNTEIFKDRTDIPETRQQFVQSLKFTQKRDPNMPARESTVNEPPIPNPLRPFGGPVHETHPLFLKDKGDDFFKQGDFRSAVNAYQKALKSNSRFFEVLLNLANCQVKLEEFDKAIENLTAALENTTDEECKAVCMLRKGACFVWKGMIAQGLELYRKAFDVLKDESITQDIIAIEKRRESNLVKLEADKFYDDGKFDMALECYLKAVDIDNENEVVYANLAQVSLKLCKTSESLSYSDKALSLLTHNTPLKVKVLLRKAIITEDLSLTEEALRLSPFHPEAEKLRTELLSKQNHLKFDEIKSKADNLLKSSNPSSAQSIYRQLLTTTTDPDLKVSLLTNISACQIMTNDYHGVITTVQRAFKLNPKPSVRLRLYCRRAKAYGELGQIFSAQCDLREALTLDPNNLSIKQDLELLQQKS